MDEGVVEPSVDVGDSVDILTVSRCGHLHARGRGLRLGHLLRSHGVCDKASFGLVVCAAYLDEFEPKKAQKNLYRTQHESERRLYCGLKRAETKGAQRVHFSFWSTRPDGELDDSTEPPLEFIRDPETLFYGASVNINFHPSSTLVSAECQVGVLVRAEKVSQA